MPLKEPTIVPDNIAVTDSILKECSCSHEFLNGVTEVEDLLTVTSKIRIKKVAPINSEKIKITFSSPAIVNAHLINKNNYYISVVTPGASNIVVTNVAIPFGVSETNYVELSTSEHTDNAEYSVTINPSVIGNNVANGEYSYNYIGKGVNPTINLVLAVSKNEVDVYFSENMLDNADIRNPNNYTWDGGLVTNSVKSVVDNIVTLQTSDQVEGQQYNLNITGVLLNKINNSVITSDQLGIVLS